jgi:hypothetical protein
MAATVLELVQPMDKVIAQLNEQFAVMIAGSQVGILRQGLSANGQRSFDVLSAASFRLLLGPEVVRTEDGKLRSAADIWLRHPKRRSYHGMCFRPGADAPVGFFNLWQGYGVEPNPKASCQRLLDHIYENVCAGSDDRYGWAMGWFAQIVQQPTQKPGTSLAFIGLQGVGKTLPGQAIGRTLGGSYILVAGPRYITGRFNSHLSDKLLVQADESFWAGDHAAEGILKDLITGTHQQIEFKGREPITVENYLRLFITSNQDWVVPAALDQRRFAVYEVEATRQNDHAYFKAIQDELDRGGYGGLLHYLMTYDLGGINLRVPPETAALLRQKIASLEPEGAWWLDVLTRGKLPGKLNLQNDDICIAAELYDHYRTETTKRSRSRMVTEYTFGHFIRKMVPGVQRVRKTVSKGDREWCYRFHSLDKCRELFGRIAQYPVDWTGDTGSADIGEAAAWE